MINENSKNYCSCPGKPELRKGEAIGMYHCEFCGAMVIAGFPHPSDEDVRDQGIQQCSYDEWIKSLREVKNDE